MLLRTYVTACGLLVSGVGGCKESPPAPVVEDSPEAKRKGECDRFATDMARTGMLAGQLMVTALDDEPESASRGRDEMKAVAQQLRRELFEKCLLWPDDVIECLPPLGILKDGCDERLVAAMDGAKPPPKDVPAGPALAWTLTLEQTPRQLAMASDGTVLVVGEGLMGVRGGEIAWRKDGEFAPWLLPLPGEPITWVAGVEDRVIAFDPTSGSERWSVSLPPEAPDDEIDDEADDDEDEPARPAKLQIAAPLGEGLLVGDASARFFRVDPKPCAPARRGQPASGPCLTADGQLPDEMLESDARLFVDGDDGRLLWESSVLRSFSSGRPSPSREAPGTKATDWLTRMTARPHDTLSHVTVAAGRLVVIVDDDVVELDSTQCRGEAVFAPSGWPQPGAFVMRGADECEECQSPPAGCRRWRTYLDQVSGAAPALLDDGGVVLHVGDYSLALDQGKPRWKTSTGGDGPLATDGTRVFGYSMGLREGDVPGLFEIAAADGTLRWLTPLPQAEGRSYYRDDMRLRLGGSGLALGLEQTLVAVQLPTSR